MLLDALHAVTVLLLGGPQVLLQGPSHGWEDGLCCFSRVHNIPRGLFLLFLLHALDMGKCFLYCHHQPGGETANRISTKGGFWGFFHLFYDSLRCCTSLYRLEAHFELTHSPCSAFAHTPLVLSLFIVQLVVAGVSAAGCGCDHRSGLRVCDSRCCIVPRTCHGKIGLDREG